MLDRCLDFAHWKLYLGKEFCREEITIFLLQVVERLNPSSSRVLANRLYNLAIQYDPKKCNCCCDKEANYD